MKLSQLNTDEALDVLCVLAPTISNIVSDTDLLSNLKEEIDKINSKNNKTNLEYTIIGAKIIGSLVPIVFEKHKIDVLNILSAINKKSLEEVKNQNSLITLKEIYELSKDKELLDFFRSCTKQEGNE